MLPLFSPQHGRWDKWLRTTLGHEQFVPISLPFKSAHRHIFEGESMKWSGQSEMHRFCRYNLCFEPNFRFLNLTTTVRLSGCHGIARTRNISGFRSNNSLIMNYAFILGSWKSVKFIQRRHWEPLRTPLKNMEMTRGVNTVVRVTYYFLTFILFFRSLWP